MMKNIIILLSVVVTCLLASCSNHPASLTLVYPIEPEEMGVVDSMEYTFVDWGGIARPALKVYSSNSDSSSIVGGLKYGDFGDCALLLSESKDWYKIKYAMKDTDITGYIRKDYCQIYSCNSTDNSTVRLVARSTGEVPAMREPYVADWSLTNLGKSLYLFRNQVLSYELVEFETAEKEDEEDEEWYYAGERLKHGMCYSFPVGGDLYSIPKCYVNKEELIDGKWVVTDKGSNYDKQEKERINEIKRLEEERKKEEKRLEKERKKEEKRLEKERKKEEKERRRLEKEQRRNNAESDDYRSREIEKELCSYRWQRIAGGDYPYGRYIVEEIRFFKDGHGICIETYITGGNKINSKDFTFKYYYQDGAIYIDGNKEFYFNGNYLRDACGNSFQPY